MAAFKLGTKLGNEIGAQLILANDPDADRIGIAIRDDKNEWYYPNGNQVGLLLLQYLLNYKKDIPADAQVITTVVSTPMIDVVAPAKNVGVMKTLTGFKYIGQKIRQFENKELKGSYLFGWRKLRIFDWNSCKRDKDALVTSWLFLKWQLITTQKELLFTKELQKLYEKFGYYLEGIKSVTLKGKDGIEQMAALMSNLRENVKDELLSRKLKLKDFFSTQRT